VLPILGRGSMDRRFPRLVDRLIADGADTGPVTSASENDEVLLLGVWSTGLAIWDREGRP
jgi:hypothetical protein